LRVSRAAEKILTPAERGRKRPTVGESRGRSLSPLDRLVGAEGQRPLLPRTGAELTAIKVGGVCTV